MIQRLRSELKSHLAQARFRKRECFLELFAGTAVVSRKIRQFGFACMAFEVNNGEQYDLTHPAIIDLVHGWIQGGVILGVFFWHQL